MSPALIKYCIDTNIIIYTMNGLRPAVDLMIEAQNHEIFYPVVVEAELYSSAELTKEDMQDIREVLDLGEIIEINSLIGLKAGELRRISKIKYNKNLKLPDALVAAVAINQSATLVTRNYDDFKHLLKEGLTVYNPFA